MTLNLISLKIHMLWSLVQSYSASYFSFEFYFLCRPWEGIKKQLHVTIDQSNCDQITLLLMVSVASKGPDGRGCFNQLDMR
jgi:hypothetical protein